MNCNLTPIRAESWFPFYEYTAEYYRQTHPICKVYSDGSSYLAIPHSSVCKSQKRIKRIGTRLDECFTELYSLALRQNVSRQDLAEYLTTELRKLFPEEWGLGEYVAEQLSRVKRNLAVCKKRFRRKAYLNKWNYFVTITYDDDKHTEESFKAKLRKCLSNMHSRRGWLYMGVFERAPETQRLHFHAVMYIPDGEMVGEIYERRDYSTKRHTVQLSHGNTFFEKRFGRSDFEALSDTELKRGNTISYLLKYLEKSEERIVYSRGIPTELTREIDIENDVVCEMYDFVLKYILFDDVVVDSSTRDKMRSEKIQQSLPS